jgi:hypothetical protein
MTFAHGFSFEVELVGVVDEPVKDGIGQRRIAEVLMPMRQWELASDQGRAAIETVIQDLQQVPLLFVGQWRHGQIIEDQQIGLGELFEQFMVTAVALGDGQFAEEAR